ncbi:MAG TPA: hypothetical protein VE999_12935 [Gemmataceae bacterium]|nr:hypothetical protein [Gemmataceae bacterium]
MAKKTIRKVKAPPPVHVKELLKIGAWVKIRNLGGQIGKIVEFRGALGPKGAHIYRVLLRRKPRRDYIELRDDQMELVEAGK